MLKHDIRSLRTLQRLKSWQTTFPHWTFTYESPFRSCKSQVEAAGIRDLLLEATGQLWAIPRDGRVEFSFSPVRLNLNKPETERMLRNLALFGLAKPKDESGIVNTSLLIYDFDPWSSQYFTYEAGSIFGGSLFATNTEWKIEWENQEFTPGENARY